jgi:ABC-type branched-subunit amino acid transport system ATPase component
MSAELLAGVGVRVHFAGVKAIDGVDLTLRRGEILGLIGPNGAGKTTLLNVLSCFQVADEGRVLLEGADVTGWTPDRVSTHGLGRTFQNVRLFGRMSVFENLEVAALGAGMRARAARAVAAELLGQAGLRERARLAAESLAHGEARRVGVLRALAMRPRYLLLDEPAAGLNEVESDELQRFLAGLPTAHELGLLIVEHDMRVIMRLCERIQVIDHGRTIAMGTPDEVRRDPAVLTAYLGSGGREADRARD